MPKNISTYAFLITPCLLMFLSGPAQSDTLYLTNGDRITGQIGEHTNRNTITLTTKYGATIQIPRHEVQIIQWGENAVRAELPKTLAERNVAKTPENPAPTPATPKLEAEKPKDPSEYKWSGRANVGGKLESGNDQGKAFNFEINTKARNDLNRFGAYGNFDWEQEDGEITEKEWETNFEYDRFVSKKWFVGTRLNFESDDLEELDLRTKIGLLTGYQFYEQEYLNLLIRFGLEYIGENYENASSEDDIALAWDLDYDQKILDDALTLFHKHEIAMPYSNTSAYLFDSKTGVRVPVGQHLVGTAEIEFEWDNEPPPGIREDDTTYNFKIGYEW